VEIVLKSFAGLIVWGRRSMSMTNASTTKPQELSSSNWGRLLELVKILQKVLI